MGGRIRQLGFQSDRGSSACDCSRNRLKSHHPQGELLQCLQSSSGIRESRRMRGCRAPTHHLLESLLQQKEGNAASVHTSRLCLSQADPEAPSAPELFLLSLLCLCSEELWRL